MIQLFGHKFKKKEKEKKMFACNGFSVNRFMIELIVGEE